MPLRDDHDAALARADALQVELDRARADDAAHDQQVARLEAELVEARTRLNRAEEALGRLRPRSRRAAEPPPRASDQPRRNLVPVTAPPRLVPTAASRRDSRREFVLAVVASLIVIVGVYLLAASQLDHPAEAPMVAPPARSP